MKRNNVSAEEVRELLNYDVDTGIFTRRIRTSPRANVGDVAGCVKPSGYRFIRLRVRTYAAHRLAWLYVYGVWPKGQIDHINGDRSDNRFVNLRECSNAENQQNQRLRRGNTSGTLGMTWRKECSKWQAQIKARGQQFYLGLFDSIDEASAVYLSAKAELHKFNPVPRREASL